MTTPSYHIHTAAEDEKRNAAMSSVIAAVGLTVMKLVAGLATGSLGILAEAAHSGLDLVAALVTYMAIRISSMPADRKHPYGHGKVENLSALVETLLLLVTCAWIFYEAFHRIFFHLIDVQVTAWSFVVMFISIAVDVSRSRMLSRTAKKHNSQALEADALHFSTDVWSSAVVIFGLVGVMVGGRFPKLAFLAQADAVAAILVALIVVYVSIRLGSRTVEALLDSAPQGMEEQIVRSVEVLPNIRDCHSVRIRSSGAQHFIDVHVSLDGELSLKQAHDLTEHVEEVIQGIVPEADVTVHPEPFFGPEITPEPGPSSPEKDRDHPSGGSAEGTVNSMSK